MKFGAQVKEDGSLTIWNRQGLIDWIKSLAGKDVVLDVSVHKRKGSRKTHAYYRGYVLPEIHQFYKRHGNEISIEEVHEMMKFRFMLREKIDPDTGELLGQYIPSSADFLQEEWNEYLEQIKRWAAEMGLYLLDPNEQAKMEI